MRKKQKFLTAIQVDVFNSWVISNPPKGKKYQWWLDKIKVYYDLVPLTEHELASIVKYIRILSRDNDEGI
jgi:hypothetical protein